MRPIVHLKRRPAHQPQGSSNSRAIAVVLVGVALVGSAALYHWHRYTRLQRSGVHLQGADGSSNTKQSDNQASQKQQQKQDAAPSAEQLEALACTANNVYEHKEFWGDVVTPGLAQPGVKGSKGLSTSSALDCCKACAHTKGCNVWVWCNDQAVCQQQCWLKRVGSAKSIEIHGDDPKVPWSSGQVPKDYDRDPATLPPLNTSISHLVLTTAFGKVRIRLMPEWSETSVDFVRRLAQMPELCTPSCEFYRAEPGFLLQGSLRAYVPPNKRTKEGPKIMERGEIGWAGGGPGPDWFIYLGDRPASHYGTSHTVWGKVADDASLAVVEKMVMQPATAPKPGDMHMLDTRISFTTGAE